MADGCAALTPTHGYYEITTYLIGAKGLFSVGPGVDNDLTRDAGDLLDLFID